MVQQVMDQFGERIGRRYHLFDYVGHPEAEQVMVMMGSGAEVAHETIDWMNAQGEKVGLLKVRLYRPFALDAFFKALPKTTKRLCVLDRTKEPGALGEPLYLDVVTALREATDAGTSPLRQGAQGDRRPLRPVLQGVHPGDGQGGLRRPGQGPAPSATSSSASWTT